MQYWRRLEGLDPGDPERPAPRICRLLRLTFEKWQTKPPWPDWDQLGHLFDGLSVDERAAMAARPVAERKGLAIQRMLEKLTDPEIARQAGTMEIDPDELVVGTPPPYSVGQGKELMRYLTEEEALEFELSFFNEWSPFGHIIPNYQRLLETGMEAMIENCRERQAALGPGEAKQRSFYQSVIDSLEGVVHYARRYAELADEKAARLPEDDPRRRTLSEVAERLRRVPGKPARTFLEAIQSFYITHCALHFTGEITSIGRLDQIFWPYYEADLADGRIKPKDAQEAIDCLWIKLGEKAILDRRYLEDRFTSSDGALLGAGGPSNFDQGSLLNQWMQQVTIGGVVADDEPQAKDATNELTYMCLAASRRLPLNSPTLDLRVHEKTPRRVLEAAAKTLLSGGAHPVLLNDDLLIPALTKPIGGSVELRSARNYACDGCFETLFAGETEFCFGFVPALAVFQQALNSGAEFGGSGSMSLRGSNAGWRTPPAAKIEDFEALWKHLERQIRVGCHRFLRNILRAYGAKEAVSPSPLLSALIDGCLETGRDLAGGGARYRVFAPLMTGISTAADSLCAIKKLVFEERRFTLEELVACLRSNWGVNPEVVGLSLPPERIAEIRALCMAQPKFGHGVRAVDEIAWRLIESFHAGLTEAWGHPMHRPYLQSLEERYGTPERKFEICFTPGVGTFEQYVLGGFFAGATADGRRAGTAIASDLSPAPLHADQEPIVETESGEVGHARQTPLLEALKSYDHPSIALLSDGAPADLNIREDFPEERLVKALETFARGKGGNVLTVTVADPETLRDADARPDQGNLLRVRMGGWSEFFVALFPAHRAQHRRRPLYTP
jgi:pyruvate-formate lyase